MNFKKVRQNTPKHAISDKIPTSSLHLLALISVVTMNTCGFYPDSLESFLAERYARLMA